MRQKMVTIKQGDKKAEVAESSFKSVWKDKGWELASEETSEEQPGPATKAADQKNVEQKTTPPPPQR